MTQLSISKTDQASCADYRDHKTIEEYFISLSESELLIVENKLLAILLQKQQRAVLGLTDQKRGVFKEMLTGMVGM